MQTLAQVRAEYVAAAAAEFLSVLTNRVETGVKTEAEANLYRSRLPRAVLLATTPHMILQASPGVYDVWSTGKNMDKVYCVDTKKQTCTCPDADPTLGKAPQGYCKHRLACFLTLQADRGVKILEARMEGLPIPHTHVYACGHEDLEACYGHECLTAQEDTVCTSCAPHDPHVEDIHMDAEDPSTPATRQPTVPLNPPDEYEVAHPYTPPQPPPCEALSSLNIEGKVRSVRVMWTMRSVLPGAAGDADIISRLPAVLAEMKKLGINFE